MDLRKVSDEDKVNLCRKYTIHICLFVITQIMCIHFPYIACFDASYEQTPSVLYKIQLSLCFQIEQFSFLKLLNLTYFADPISSGFSYLCCFVVGMQESRKAVNHMFSFRDLNDLLFCFVLFFVIFSLIPINTFLRRLCFAAISLVCQCSLVLQRGIYQTSFYRTIKTEIM